jgi:hypothetical protein
MGAVQLTIGHRRAINPNRFTLPKKRRSKNLAARVEAETVTLNVMLARSITAAIVMSAVAVAFGRP